MTTTCCVDREGSGSSIDEVLRGHDVGYERVHPPTDNRAPYRSVLAPSPRNGDRTPTCLQLIEADANDEVVKLARDCVAVRVDKSKIYLADCSKLVSVLKLGAREEVVAGS